MSAIVSSLLLAQAAQHHNRAIHCFSLGFSSNGKNSEIPAASAIAKHFCAEHSGIVCDPAILLGRLPFVVWSSDDLIMDPAMLPTSLLAEMSGREYKVVFTGEGEDEVFGGYGQYRRQPLITTLRSLLIPGSGGFRTRTHWTWRQARTAYGKKLINACKTRRTALSNAWNSTPP